MLLPAEVLLLVNGVLIGLLTGWLMRSGQPARKGSSSPATSGQTETLRVQEHPGQMQDPSSPASKLARLQAVRDGKTEIGPNGEAIYMIASECIVFRGTQDQCFDFLSARGVIPFESAIEPLDLRIQENLNLLGVGLVDYWKATPAVAAEEDTEGIC